MVPADHGAKGGEIPQPQVVSAHRVEPDEAIQEIVFGHHDRVDGGADLQLVSELTRRDIDG